MSLQQGDLTSLRIPMTMVLPCPGPTDHNRSFHLIGKITYIDNDKNCITLLFSEIIDKKEQHNNTSLRYSTINSTDKKKDELQRACFYKKLFKSDECMSECTEEDLPLRKDAKCKKCRQGFLALRGPSLRKQLITLTNKTWKDLLGRNSIQIINLCIAYDHTKKANLLEHDRGLAYTAQLIHGFIEHYFEITPQSTTCCFLDMLPPQPVLPSIQQPPSITNHEGENLSTMQPASSSVNNTQDDHVPPISPLQTQQPDATSSAPQPASHSSSIPIKDLLCDDEEPVRVSNSIKTTSKKPPAKRLKTTHSIISPTINANDSQATTSDKKVVIIPKQPEESVLGCIEPLA